MYVETVQDFLDTQIPLVELDINAKITMGTSEEVEYRRASMAGDCPRKLAFFKINAPRPVMATRGSAVLATGSWMHWLIMEWARRGYTLKERLFTMVTEIEGDLSQKCVLPSGYELKSVHPDLLVNHQQLGRGVGEIKTLSNYGFLEMVNGEVEYRYRVQAAINMYASNSSHVFFWPYRKETSNIRERIFFDGVPGSVSSSYYSKNVSFLNDEQNVAIDVAKIITDVDNLYQAIDEITTIEQVLHAFPEASNPFICTNTRSNCRKCGGTGQVIKPELKFPCSYCPFMNLCWRVSEMKIDEGSPHYYVSR